MQKEKGIINIDMEMGIHVDNTINMYIDREEILEEDRKVKGDRESKNSPISIIIEGK